MMSAVYGASPFLGFILTQMEEPGQMLTAVCIIALRWHEYKERRGRVSGNRWEIERSRWLREASGAYKTAEQSVNVNS